MKTVPLNEHGDSIGPRVLGLQLSKSILEDLRSDTDMIAVIDFNGIKNLSSGFALELFGNLKAAFGKDFPARVKIKFTGNEGTDSQLKAIIFRALQTPLPARS